VTALLQLEKTNISKPLGGQSKTCVVLYPNWAKIFVGCYGRNALLCNV